MGKNTVWATLWDIDEGIPIDFIIDSDQYMETFHIKVCKRSEKHDVCLTFRVGREDLDGLILWVQEMMKG